jgi:hypothetical protein
MLFEKSLAKIMLKNHVCAEAAGGIIFFLEISKKTKLELYFKEFYFRFGALLTVRKTSVGVGVLLPAL